jgi:hypothetical protein
VTLETIVQCMIFQTRTILRRGRFGERREIMTDPEKGDSRRGAVAGLLIALLMLAVGLWLARDLTAASKMQDCLMSGRTNCNVIQLAQ